MLVILLRSWAEAGEAAAKRLADRLFRRLERIDKKKKLMDIVKSCREYDVRYRHLFLGDECRCGSSQVHLARVIDGIMGKCGCDGKNCPLAFITYPLPPLGVEVFKKNTQNRTELSAIVPMGDTYVAKWIRDSVEQCHMCFVPVSIS